MTATKEEKKNDNKDEKYKIVYNEIVKAPIWKKAAEMNINKSVSIKKNKKINIGAKMTIREYINKTRDIILLKNSCEIKSNRINNKNGTVTKQQRPTRSKRRRKEARSSSKGDSRTKIGKDRNKEQ